MVTVDETLQEEKMYKPALPRLTPEARALALYYASLFSVEGKPGDEMITEGQLILFAALIFRWNNRLQLICTTQYGKSLWTALACIVVSCLQNEVIAVVAPSDAKAKIIMRYYIQHLGDSKLFSSHLEKNTKLDRLKMEESKERIMLRDGGGIFVISAQSKTPTKSVEAAMGEGARIVIGDEYGLIADNTESTIYRMIAGKGPDGFYCKIGNPFYSMPPYTHFKKSWNNNKYTRIFIDYKQALKEGRYNSEFIEEARDKPLFEVLYGCEFPPEDSVDPKGYRPLITLANMPKKTITLKELEALMEADRVEAGTYIHPETKLETKRYRYKTYTPKLGSDIGAGGDLSVCCLRWGPYAAFITHERTGDTMANVPIITGHILRFHIPPEEVYVDDIGVGRGVRDRLIEIGYSVTGVSVGAPAMNTVDFYNRKAENCWAGRAWLLNDESTIVESKGWLEVPWFRYKVSSERKVQIEPKPDQVARTQKSPDYADAFFLTFYQRPFVGIV